MMSPVASCGSVLLPSLNKKPMNPALTPETDELALQPSMLKSLTMTSNLTAVIALGSCTIRSRLRLILSPVFVNVPPTTR